MPQKLVEGTDDEDDDFVVYGGDLPYPPLKNNIGDSFLGNMLKNADRIAQIDPINNITYTHGDIRKYSIRCALEMRARGVQKGDIITICGRNHSNLIIPLLASVYLGGTANPIHPLFSYNEVRRMLNITEPRMIFCDEEATLLMKKVKFELGLSSQVVTFETEFEPFMEPRKNENEENHFTPTTVDPETSIIFIVCTSGTTGFVKGVMFTHTEYYYTLISAENDLVQRDDVVLLYSPLSWVTAIWTTGQIFRTGAQKIICEYNETRNLDIMHRYKVTWALFTPLKIIEMIRHPIFARYPSIPENLKILLFGGSATTNEQFLEFRRVFPNTIIYNAYGSTEMHGVHAYYSRTNPKHVEMNKSKVNSVGLPLTGAYMKIINQDTGKALPRNIPGELCVKGPTLTKGYYKDSEATAKAIDDDGWYHTGDIGKIDDDNVLFIVGRSKELLKYKGWQVSPSELEEVIREHPAVQNACVMGKPHETDGDLPLAFVIKNEEFVDISEEDIAAFVNERVSEMQQLRAGVIFVDKFPLTAAGKIRRVELQNLVPI